MNYNKNSPFRAVFLSLTIGLGSIVLGSYAFALPEGGSVVAGDATISAPNTDRVEIHQSSNKAIINWNDFNIGRNQSVEFYVPGVTSATLNRIVGGNASEILGSLKSNGQLWIINPNGILFGPNAQVNVAGLVASTMSMSNQDFMSGRYQLAQENASQLAKIVNQGAITAEPNGFIALIAPQVENSGIIDAKLGVVALGTGQRSTLVFSGNNLLNFSVQDGTSVPMYDLNGNPVAALSHSGEIHADGGVVLLTSDSINNLLDQSINVSGVIKADSMAEKSGKVILSSRGDTLVTGNVNLSAQGLEGQETGGTIQVLGNRVALLDNTQINASGNAGGGTILIGGDYKGENSEIQNSQYTVVGRNVSIKGNALQNGNGGKVIAWSDQNTLFYGNIEAKGGPQGGDGGFIETSGKQYLDVTGANISTLASKGSNGMWLLDPYDVTIQSNGGSNQTITVTGSGSGPFTYTPTANSSIIDVGLLTTSLSNGNVTVNTGSSGNQTGMITLNSAITFNGSSDSMLTLSAAGGITISQPIIDNGGGGNLSVVLIAGQVNPGGISIAAPINIGGSLTATAGGSGVIGSINVSNLVVSADRGIALTSNAPNNGIAFATGASLRATDPTLGDITLTESDSQFQTIGNFILSAGLQAGHNLTISRSNGDIIQTQGNIIVGNLATFTLGGAGGAILLNGGTSNNTIAGLAFSGVTAADNMPAALIKTISNITLNNLTALSGSQGDIIIQSTAGDITQAAGTTIEARTGTVGLQTNTGGVSQNSTTSAINADEIAVLVGNGVVNLQGNNNFIGLLNITNMGSNPISLNLYNAGYTSSLPPIAIVGSAGTGNTKYGSFTFSGPNVTSAANLNVFLNPVLSNIDNPSTFDLNLSLPGYGNQLVLTNMTFRDLSLALGGEVTFNSVSIGNNLNVNTSSGNGNITDAGASGVSVAGTSTLNAGTGNIVLDYANNSFTGSVSSIGNDITLANSRALDLATTTASQNLSVTATGAITDSGTISAAGTTTLDAGNNNITLDSNSNDFGGAVTVTSGQNVVLSDSNALTLDAITTSGTFSATAGGALTQSGAVTTGGTTSLTGTSIANNNTLNVGTHSLNLTTTGGNITQTGNMIASTTVFNTSGGAVSLAGNNNFVTVSSTGTLGTVQLHDINAIILGAMNTGALTVTAAGDLTQSGAINASDSVNLSSNTTLIFNGPGSIINLTNGVNNKTITLVADQFTNTSNSTINLGAGSDNRWLFYINNLSGNNFGTLNSNSQAVWGTFYGDSLPSIAATGNRYIFGTAQNLSAVPLSTPFDTSKNYGDMMMLQTATAAGSNPNYQVIGFVNAGSYGNVFTQDTADNLPISGLSYMSSGTSISAEVSNSPYAIRMTGTGASNTGYGVTYNNMATFGNLIVNPAPLTIAANNASRAFDTPNPTFTATYTGFVNGQDAGVLLTPVDFSTSANTSSPIGNYAIIPSNATAANYTISFVNGLLTVTGAPLPPSPAPTPSVPAVLVQNPAIYSEAAVQNIPQTTDSSFNNSPNTLGYIASQVEGEIGTNPNLTVTLNNEVDIQYEDRDNCQVVTAEGMSACKNSQKIDGGND